MNRGHINNYGFVNDQDYRQDQPGNVLVVIGDSYIEALMVPYKDTLHGRLARLVHHTGRVYSLGISGSQLSQYLAFARYAQQEFRPAAMVFVIIGNDFDESLWQYKRAPGLHYFQEDELHTLRLIRVDYTPQWFRRVIGRFAVVRYMNSNGGMSSLTRRLRVELARGSRQDLLYVGNTEARADAGRLAESRRVVEAFFRDLSEIVHDERSKVLFVVDGMRPQLYTDEGMRHAQGSYVDVMRTYFMNVAHREGYAYVDMQEIFITRYHLDGVRFEFPTDSHWNSTGHAMAAQAVAASAVFQRTFPHTERLE